MPVFMYFMQHARTMENFAAEMDFGRQSVLFPSRLADLYLGKYFFLMKECMKNRLVGDLNSRVSEGAFCLCILFLFLKVRIYMNPKIYRSEIAQVKGKVGMLCGEYGRLGRAWILLWRIVIFNPFIPSTLFTGFGIGTRQRCEKTCARLTCSMNTKRRETGEMCGVGVRV